MTIGELAKAADVNVQTVRYYEREGLLPRPHRWRDNNYRDFDDEALTRLRFIRSAKELGFTLREIKELLDLRTLSVESCRDVEQLIGTKLTDLEKRLADLRRLRRVLTKMRTACHSRKSDQSCPALWAIQR